MKLTRKLIAAMLSVCMVMSLVTTAFAAEIQATYDEASYYDIAVTAYSRMLAFQNGGVVAAADQSQKYGLIDATGKVVVPFQYAKVWALDGGLFAVAQNVNESRLYTGFGVINASGETVLAPSDSCYGVSCRNGVIRVNTNYDYQFYTTDWKPASEDDYYAGTFYDYQEPEEEPAPSALAQYSRYDEVGGYYMVWQYDRETYKTSTGVLDSDYKVVVPVDEYENVGTPNSDGYISVTKLDGTTDLYRNGQVVKTFTDKKVTTEVYYRYMTFTTTDGDKYGMINADGKILLEEKFDMIDADANGYLRTAINKEDSWEYDYGLYTQECEQVFADEYSEISYLAEGKYRLHKDQYFGVSLVSGTKVTSVIPMKYVDMRVHTHQFIELYDGSKYSVVDLSNNVVVPESSQAINAFKGDPSGLYYTITDVMWNAKSWDGYTKSVLPFMALTDNGWVTVYADYETGEVSGQVNTRASNINEDGWFVYQNDAGLYGLARVEGAAAPTTPTTPSTPDTPSTPTTPDVPAADAVLSPQKLAVDGEDIECEKYNIGGSNYFKLRDLAYLLNGTGSQFGVGFDEATATVSITTGQAYEPAGTELATGVDNSATAQTSSQSILIDGTAHGELTVYNIGGSNFFQLRELGTLLGFEVGYDVDTNTAIVRSVQN